MTDGAVYVITGASAAGKTTVGRLLAERFEHAVFLEGDAFRRAIVSGRREMTPDASREALAQLRLRHRIAGAAADAYVAEGFTVVVEDVIAGPLLPEFVELIAGRPLHVAVLLPSIDALAARDGGRSTSGYGDFSIEQLHAAFAEDTPRLGLWLDSSAQSPEQTVDEILAHPDRTLVAR